MLQMKKSEKVKIMTHSIMDITKNSEDMSDIPRSVICRKNPFSIDSLLSNEEKNCESFDENPSPNASPVMMGGSEMNLRYLMQQQHQPPLMTPQELDYHQRMSYHPYMDFFRHSRLFYPQIELNGEEQKAGKFKRTFTK